MHSHHILACLLALLTAFCAATGKKNCATYYGSKTVRRVPTTTKTITRTVTPIVKVTKTPKTTITPAPITSTTTSTSTSTVTSTTQTTDTDTTTITISETSTVTDPTTTITETSTSSTSTSTTSTSFTTVAATAGFTPIQSSVPGSSYSGNFGGPAPPAAKRNAQSERRSSARKPFALSKNNECRKFPQRVACTVTKTVTAYPRTVTKTAPVKTKTATASTTVVTSTATTFTTTTSALEPADTTVTESTTTTSITTTTPSTTTTETTTTTTTTTIAATATTYAQCLNANNYADTLDGNYGVQINDVTPNNNFMTVSGPANALDCCNICAGNADCGVSAWSQQTGNECYISLGCNIQWQMFNDDTNFIFNNGCNEVTRR
ncbi:hypothetical protein CKM354_000099400 [Cercospora kikuchii]|uniref:Apple domain-containing protein n=1 Tax=Cercospora kikuchii TaxID=84275 RepID=A0A9P3CBY6_9PEZI|nr:uncharacterized protein CKM354_000099400 [Cercospora kikuchii]GIZ37550.1 hypothetical protein CKM354_000099400 [Cercospora kikuchii]